MNFDALHYEEFTINSFPALQTEVYDGWILRFCGGSHHEGNCVNPLYLSTKAYEDKIDYCEKKYTAHSLPCIFKMTANVPSSLDQQLAERGYLQAHKTHIMECSLNGEIGNVPENICIRLSRNLTTEWLEAWLRLRREAGHAHDITDQEEEKTCIQRLFSLIPNPVYCAALYDGSRLVGCSLGVLEEKRLGLYDLCVENTFRQQGYATAMCQAIMEEGHKSGADTICLQVEADNHNAVRLYEKLGFVRMYTCWYRVKNRV